jgi:hypothetical protein
MNYLLIATAITGVILLSYWTASKRVLELSSFVYYSQKDPRWGGVVVGDSVDTTMTISMAGSALVSSTMLLEFYGSDKNPLQVNDWLKANGGFSGGVLNFSVLGALTGKQVKASKDVSTVLKKYAGVIPLIAMVGEEQFVLVTGVIEETGEAIIFDPRDEKVQGSPLSKTGMQISQLIWF